MKGSLPRNWEMWPLGKLGSWIGGGTPASSQVSYWNGEIPWITPKDMKTRSLASSQEKITSAAVENSAAKIIEAGAILFVTRSGILAHSFPVATTTVRTTINQDLKAISPVEVIDAEYVAWALRGLERTILKSCSKHGTTVHSIEMPALKRLGIPVPPLTEQRRIVIKIEELFSELDKGAEVLTVARAQLKAYRESVLKDAFRGELTKHWRSANRKAVPDLLADIQAERKALKIKNAMRPGTGQHDRALAPVVPEKWVTVHLGNLNVEIFDGPFGSHLKTADYVETGIRVIRLENIGRGRFIDDRRSFVSEKKYQDIKRHTVMPGDIVFSSFVTESIRSTLIPIHIPFAVNKADCFAIRFRGKNVSPKYVHHFLQSRNAFKQIEGMIHGVGRPRINTSQLKEIVVPLCSLAEQELIVESIEAILSRTDSFEATIEAGLNQISALRRSILKQALSGQLVAQDPADDSASAVLERIRAVREECGAKKQRNNKIDR